MKINKIAIIPLIIFGFLLTAQIASAGIISGGVQNLGQAVYGVETPQSPQILAALIIQTLLGLLGIISVAMILYAGFLYLTSQGQEPVLKKAKGILTTAIIGIVIILSAYAIASFITSQIINSIGTGSSTGGENPPGTEPPGTNPPGTVIIQP
ncbi:MAG: hypothetical protein WC460_02550 [Patescibacteria group bacterium]